jgi:hypothetical protein
MRRLRNVRRVVRWVRGAVAQLRKGTDHSAWPITEGEVYLNDSTSASPFNYPAAEISPGIAPCLFKGAKLGLKERN